MLFARADIFEYEYEYGEYEYGDLYILSWSEPSAHRPTRVGTTGPAKHCSQNAKARLSDFSLQI